MKTFYQCLKLITPLNNLQEYIQYPKSMLVEIIASKYAGLQRHIDTVFAYFIQEILIRSPISKGKNLNFLYVDGFLRNFRIAEYK